MSHSLALPFPRGRYGCIVVDPPWPQRGAGKWKRKCAAAHYRTMTLTEIADLPMARLANRRGCHLWLWVIAKRLHVALHILEGWGFKQVSYTTWVKVGSIGLGRYLRNKSELCLLATRGPVRMPDPSDAGRSAFMAQRGAHSTKPDKFFEMVERISPSPRIELFARKARKGWDRWGDESPS